MMVSWSVDEKIAQSTVKAGPAFVIPEGGTVTGRALVLTSHVLSTQQTTQISLVRFDNITMKFNIMVTLVLSAATIRIRKVLVFIRTFQVFPTGESSERCL